MTRGLQGRGTEFVWCEIICCFMWHLLATEIPPAGAPLGAGFAVRQWLVGALDFW